jgi:hypothetical protein
MQHVWLFDKIHERMDIKHDSLRLKKWSVAEGILKTRMMKQLNPEQRE